MRDDDKREDAEGFDCVSSREHHALLTNSGLELEVEEHSPSKPSNKKNKDAGGGGGYVDLGSIHQNLHKQCTGAKGKSAVLIQRSTVHLRHLLLKTQTRLSRNNSFSTRHVLMVSFLAFCSVVFVKHIGSAMYSMKSVETERQWDDGGAVAAGFHDGSGGAKPQGAGAILAPVGGLQSLDVEAVPDPPAVEPHQGETDEYSDFDLTDLNDSDISPYADSRLNTTSAQRRQELSQWLSKMDGIREKYGYWNFHDTYLDRNGKPRPTVDFAGTGTSGEIPREAFPEDSWQTDPEYVEKFIAEARDLISRVREGIYEEYGIPESDDRSKNFGIQFIPSTSPSPNGEVDPSYGLAWMTLSSFHSLAKRLLNAMLTNDHYYVVMGGHSSAAGHGNNFHQSYMMQFHELMEPVFDRLGMTLKTSNRAMGGVGTLHSSMAGASIYGEKDFMMWDSSMTEKGAEQQDAFMRQALLTGHRVPFLFASGADKSGSAWRMHKEAGAHVGGMKDGADKFVPRTVDLKQVETLPHSVQHLFCEPGVESCKENKYNSRCWLDERVDVVPPKRQNGVVSGQASWHPGFRYHRWVGRKLSLLFLLALEEALVQWEDATYFEGGHPPADEHWHVSEEDETIREMVGDRSRYYSDESPCEKVLTFIPRACHTPMRGYAEWTPRADPDNTSIRSIMKAAPNGYVPYMENGEQLYRGKEVPIPVQKIPPGEVDVVAIAQAMPKRRQWGRYLASWYRQHNLRRWWVDSAGSPVDRTEGKSQGKSPRQSPLSYSKESDSQKQEGRALLADGEDAVDDEELDVVPGKGAQLISPKTGFCDGTAYAECGRDSSSNCLMSGHNDGRNFIQFDGLSGWLVFDFKGMTQGIVMSRMEWWLDHNSNTRTEGWTEVNNGTTYATSDTSPPTASPIADTSSPMSSQNAAQGATPNDDTSPKVDEIPAGRKLKGPPPEFPNDFMFDIAVDGKIVSSWDKKKFKEEEEHRVAYNVDFYVLLNDVEMAKDGTPRDVEFAIRISGGGREAVLALTHLYYA